MILILHDWWYVCEVVLMHQSISDDHGWSEPSNVIEKGYLHNENCDNGCFGGSCIWCALLKSLKHGMTCDTLAWCLRCVTETHDTWNDVSDVQLSALDMWLTGNVYPSMDYSAKVV